MTMHSISELTVVSGTAKIVFMVIESNTIITTIHRYRKYVRDNLLPDLYCAKNDGTHLPLVSRMDQDDNVYLYCLTCDYEKQVGLVTADTLNTAMRWRDLNPSAPLTQ
jgi:hypothetical protein